MFGDGRDGGWMIGVEDNAGREGRTTTEGVVSAKGEGDGVLSWWRAGRI